MTLTNLSRPAVRAQGLVASVSDVSTAAVITLRGEADLFTLPVVVDVLARAIADHDGTVVVDLADTEFIDTGTVRAVACARQFLDDHGRTLTVRSPSKLAARILGLFGLSGVIDQTTAA